MTNTSTRRAVLAGAAAMPALSLPAIAIEPDPIFAAIKKHKGLEKDRLNLWLEFDEAERCADTHRPIALVSWRNYSIRVRRSN
jgi:hypothetical protein